MKTRTAFLTACMALGSVASAMAQSDVQEQQQTRWAVHEVDASPHAEVDGQPPVATPDLSSRDHSPSQTPHSTLFSPAKFRGDVAGPESIFRPPFADRDSTESNGSFGRTSSASGKETTQGVHSSHLARLSSEGKERTAPYKIADPLIPQPGESLGFSSHFGETPLILAGNENTFHRKSFSEFQRQYAQPHLPRRHKSPANRRSMKEKYEQTRKH